MFVHGETTRVLPVYIHLSVQAENNINYRIYGGAEKVIDVYKITKYESKFHVEVTMIF